MNTLGRLLTIKFLLDAALWMAVIESVGSKVSFGDECYTYNNFPSCFEIDTIQLSQTLSALSTIDASLFHYLDLIQVWNGTNRAGQYTC
jgi:hypothetical protein